MTTKLTPFQLVLGLLAVLSTVVALFLPVFMPNIVLDPSVKQALIASSIVFMQFVFGSSLGSKDKDGVIKNLHDTLSTALNALLPNAPAPGAAPAPAPEATPPAAAPADPATAPAPTNADTLAAFAKQLLPVLTDAQVEQAVAGFFQQPK